MNKGGSNDIVKFIDQIDCEMIRILQKDGRTPNTEIAKKSGFPNQPSGAGSND